MARVRAVSELGHGLGLDVEGLVKMGWTLPIQMPAEPNLGCFVEEPSNPDPQ